MGKVCSKIKGSCGFIVAGLGRSSVVAFVQNEGRLVLKEMTADVRYGWHN